MLICNIVRCCYLNQNGSSDDGTHHSVDVVRGETDSRNLQHTSIRGRSYVRHEILLDRLLHCRVNREKYNKQIQHLRSESINRIPQRPKSCHWCDVGSEVNPVGFVWRGSILREDIECWAKICSHENSSLPNASGDEITTRQQIEVGNWKNLQDVTGQPNAMVPVAALGLFSFAEIRELNDPFLS